MSTSSPIAGIPSPELGDSPSIETTIGPIITAIDSQVVPRFASASARNVAITAPVFGQLAAVSGTEEMYMYNGTAWVSVKPRTFYKSNFQVVSASTVLVDDTHIQIALEADGVYTVRLQLMVNHSTTGDIQVAWTDPGVLSCWRTSRGPTADGSTSASAAMSAVSTSLRGTATITTAIGHDLTTNHPTPVMEELFIVQGASPGTLKLQWAQASASGTTTVLAGSWAEISKVG